MCDQFMRRNARNIDAIRKIVEKVSIRIQVGGGIRDLNAVKRYLDMGVSRVIIGTEAIRNPNLVELACASFPGRIVVGIDAREGMVAIEGWTETTRVRAVPSKWAWATSQTCWPTWACGRRDPYACSPRASVAVTYS